MANSAKGTMENPYSMSECDSMLDNGTWPGGYVKDDSGEVTYVMKSVTVWGYSGSGSGSDWGSDDDWGSDNDDGSGSDDWSGSDDGDDGKGVTGNEGGNPGGNPGGSPGGNPGGGGSPGGISLSVMTQSEFDNISKACAVTPAVSSMLKTLYDGKKIVTYPTGTYTSAARYNSSKKRLEISRQSVSDNMESTVYHELVHYVQDQKGLLADTSCNSEFQAHLMVCYIKVYRDFAWGNMPGFNDADADKIINPFYEFFDAIKEGKSETWLLMEDTLNNADWGEYTEKFQKYWKGKTNNRAYTSNYNSTSPWRWKEMFQAFGLIGE